MQIYQREGGMEKIGEKILTKNSEKFLKCEFLYVKIVIQEQLAELKKKQKKNGEKEKMKKIKLVIGTKL